MRSTTTFPYVLRGNAYVWIVIYVHVGGDGRVLTEKKKTNKEFREIVLGNLVIMRVLWKIFTTRAVVSSIHGITVRCMARASPLWWIVTGWTSFLVLGRVPPDDTLECGCESVILGTKFSIRPRVWTPTVSLVLSDASSLIGFYQSQEGSGRVRGDSGDDGLVWGQGWNPGSHPEPTPTRISIPRDRVCPWDSIKYCIIKHYFSVLPHWVHFFYYRKIKKGESQGKKCFVGNWNT